jgi:hypothetical protein
MTLRISVNRSLPIPLRSDVVLTIANRVRAVQSLLRSDASCAQGLVFVEYLHTLEPSSMEAVRPLIERLSGLWPHANGHRRCTSAGGANGTAAGDHPARRPAVPQGFQIRLRRDAV